MTVDAVIRYPFSAVVGQERLTPNIRSTVGTVTDANAMLRILFSRLATPRLGSPQAYSFNVASISGSASLWMTRMLALSSILPLSIRPAIA